MGEYRSDLPTMALIELDRPCVRLNDANVQCLMATSRYFSLPLREETLTDPISPAFAKNP